MNDNRVIGYLDHETSSLNAFYGQIIQTAAVAEKRGEVIGIFNEFAGMDPFRLLTPGSFINNKVPLSEIKNGQKLRVMLHKMDDFFQRVGPCVWFAHNAPFDFRHLYNARYQNLISPDFYNVKTAGNILCDSYQLARSIYLTDPNAINVEINDEGVPIFTLESLCRQNNIELLNSHEAMQDTLALSELVSLMKSRSPENFESIIRFSQKKLAQERVRDQIFSMTDLGYGKNLRMAPVVMMGKDSTGTRGLFLDLSKYSFTHQLPSVQEILKCLEGDDSGLPFALIKLNESKIFFGIDHCALGNQQKMIRKASHARRNKALKEICSQAVSIFCTYEKSEYVEEKIFESFPTFMERNFLDAFNSMAINEKHESISLFKGRLSSKRLLILAKRIIAAHYPDCYESQIIEEFHQWSLNRIFTKEEKPWMTFNKAEKELSALKIEYSSNPFKQSRIREYESYLHNDLKHLIGYGRSQKVV
jgi:exonuclease I